MLPAGGLTVFHGLRPPPIGLWPYLERLARYTRASPAAFVMALAYMDTMAQVRHLPLAHVFGGLPPLCQQPTPHRCTLAQVRRR